MALDYASKIGAAIGSMSKEQDTIKENISPDDPEDQFQIVTFEFLRLGGTATLTQLMYPTDSFILDHPVYGELDSNVLQIDGGYDTGHPDHDTVMDTQTF